MQPLMGYLGYQFHQAVSPVLQTSWMFPMDSRRPPPGPGPWKLALNVSDFADHRRSDQVISCYICNRVRYNSLRGIYSSKQRIGDEVQSVPRIIIITGTPSLVFGLHASRDILPGLLIYLLENSE